MAARALPIASTLRNIRGEAPGFAGTHFNANQGETCFFSDPAHPNWDASEGRIFLVELVDGSWLADQAANSTLYGSREEALTAAASLVIWRVTKRAGEIGYAQASAIINWAAELANMEAPELPQRPAKSAVVAEASAKVDPPAEKPQDVVQMGLFG